MRFRTWFALFMKAGAVAVLVVALHAQPASADTLRITNITTRPGYTPKVVRLSDLIVYPQNPFLAPITYLQPNDGSDDVFVNIGSVITLEIPFAVDRFMISETEGGKERRSVYLHMRSQLLTALLDDGAGNPLFLAVNTDLYTDPPAVGTVLAFADGLNSSRPDWFVGTALDLATGTVSGPYTGSAVVQASDLEVSLVPEPTSVVLLGAGVCGVLGYSWRRSGSRRNQSLRQ